MKLAYLLCWSTCFSDKVGWQVPRECLLVLGCNSWISLEKKPVMHKRWGREGKESAGDLLQN